MASYWLMKSKPEECSVDEVLSAPKATVPRAVCATTGRTTSCAMRVGDGDGVLFYHSSCAEPGIVGIAQVASTPHPDGRNDSPMGRYPVPIFSCILDLVLSGFPFNRSVLTKTTS